MIGESECVKTSKVYKNAGNPELLALLSPASRSVLDVGCGAGDNARLLRSQRDDLEVFGITISEAEAELARPFMKHCWVTDIAHGAPSDLEGMLFDAIIFSHVLEHLSDPASVLASFAPRVRARGQVLIAVPNVLNWRTRLAFLGGRFEYEPSGGVLDDTHLRFFTYDTADRYLLSRIPGFGTVAKSGVGSVPLWWLRRYVLPTSMSAHLDRIGCSLLPNLFASQVMISVTKLEGSAPR